MKRLAIMLCVAASVVCANAKILRVCNISGSSAPYSTIAQAHDVAADGDTIFIEGSPNGYDVYAGIPITKRLVLIGPGYMLLENGIMEDGADAASLGKINIQVQGVHVYGLTLGTVNIEASDVVVSRCITGDIWLNKKSRCIIHQNHIMGGLYGTNKGSFDGAAAYASITNNIFDNNTIPNYANFRRFISSTIKYNTWINNLGAPNHFIFSDLDECTVENNILPKAFVSTESNHGENNYVFDETPFTNKKTEVDIKNTELSFSQGKYGAFSGDDPYVISGIPAGAIIQDVTIPASVEQDKNLKVTVKLGIQQ